MRLLPLLVPLTLALSLPSSMACSRAARCPTLPPPATVTVRPDPLPCRLPPLPQGRALGLVPDGGRFVAERPAVEALLVYLASVQAWMTAAQTCVESRR